MEKTWKWRCCAVFVFAAVLAFWAGRLGAQTVSDYPGTPTTNWANPDPQSTGFFIVLGRGTGPQPVVIEGAPAPVLAGDMVLLNDPSGGDSYTNWRAVVSVFNPADPTGVKGLDATESESFFPTNKDPDYFFHLALLPRTVFTAVQSTNADGSIVASFKEFGPGAGLASGQVLEMDFEAPVPFIAPPNSATNPPILSISFPTEGEVLTNQPFSAIGTTTVVSNGAQVLTVWVRLNDGPWYDAVGLNGLTNWESDGFVLNPGTNVLQAYAVDAAGRVSDTNTVTFSYAVTFGGIFSGPPGTPEDGWNNSGGLIVSVSEGGGFGVQPISDSGNIFDAYAGDVVMLLSTNGGESPTNWEAVIHFFNPQDLTGTIGLQATEYQTFFSPEKGSAQFAGFHLLPNTVFSPIVFTNEDGSIVADTHMFGPAGNVQAGQEAILLYTALPQPQPFSVTLGASSALQLTNGVPVEIHGAIPGSTYEFQYSSNLVTWISVTPSVVAVTNTISWTDSGLPGNTNGLSHSGTRFYRATVLP